MSSPVRPDADHPDSVAARRARTRRALELLRRRTGYGHQFKLPRPSEGGDQYYEGPRDSEFRRPDPAPFVVPPSEKNKPRRA